jgi:hypothetical protein
MTMAELKTKPTDASVDDFIKDIADERKRQDSRTILDLMKEVSGYEPRMWGDSIIGFGVEHYKYTSGREGDWPVIGFSPRKQNLTLYLMYGFEKHSDLLEKLGKHKIGKACLYINKLSDIDMPTLKQLVERSLSEKQ